MVTTMTDTTREWPNDEKPQGFFGRVWREGVDRAIAEAGTDVTPSERAILYRVGAAIADRAIWGVCVGFCLGAAVTTLCILVAARLAGVF